VVLSEVTVKRGVNRQCNCTCLRLLTSRTCSSELYLELRSQNELMCNITRIFAFHECNRYDYKVSFRLLLTDEKVVL
jgi:hypothetical protein